jgi:hypothetical protein
MSMNQLFSYLEHFRGVKSLHIEQAEDGSFRVKWQSQWELSSEETSLLLEYLLPGSGINTNGKQTDAELEVFSALKESGEYQFWLARLDSPESAIIHPIGSENNENNFYIRCFSLSNVIDSEVFEKLNVPTPQSVFEQTVVNEGGFVRGYLTIKEGIFALVTQENVSKDGYSLYRISYPDLNLEGYVFTCASSDNNWIQFFEARKAGHQILEGQEMRSFSDSKELQAFLLAQELEEYKLPPEEEEHDLFHDCPANMIAAAVDLTKAVSGLELLESGQKVELLALLEELEELPSNPMGHHKLEIYDAQFIKMYRIKLSPDYFSLEYTIGEEVKTFWELGKDEIWNKDGSLSYFAVEALDVLSRGGQVLVNDWSEDE